MRKWHRWLSLLFGIFGLWIAVTGVLSQIGSLVNNGGFEKESAERGKAQVAAIGDAVVAPAAAHEDDERAPTSAASDSEIRAEPASPHVFACPADMTCRPKRVAKPGDWNLGLLHHLHSGETFGPAGTVILTLSGLAMVFFSFSGLWMYISMWRNRSVKSLKPGWFWK